MGDRGGVGSSAESERLVREHEAYVRGVAWRLTGNAHDAEDLAQDTFVRALGGLARFTPEHEASERAWLRRIATNLHLDQARRRQRLRMDPWDLEGDTRLPSRESADSRLLDASFDEDVARALAGLTPDHRTTVVLCDIEERSHQEVAALLGVRPGTVRSRLHRARGQLRAALAHRGRPGRRSGGPGGLPALV